MMKSNTNRKKLTDDEIDKQQNFEKLVQDFKQQSLNKAKQDSSWWKNKKIIYSTVIAGLAVVCTVTLISILKEKKTTSKNKISQAQVKQDATIKKFINPPIKNLNNEFEKFKVNNQKGGTHVSKNQSKIVVPKNCFKSKNGETIVGDVTISFREFHTIPEIICSGIPMKYDSAGKHSTFESAGMFEIAGSNNDGEILFNQNKSIEVVLSSNKSDSKFNQYVLDTVAKNWKYIQHDKVLNPIKSKNNFQKDSTENTLSKKYSKKIDSVKIVYTSKIESLAKPLKPNEPKKFKQGDKCFKIDGLPEEFPELMAFDNMLFEVGKENKNYCNELSEITWTDIKVSAGPKKGVNYLLTLSYRNRKENLIVYPLYDEKNYPKAAQIYSAQLTEYQALQAKRLAEEKRLVAEMEKKQTDFIAEQKRLQLKKQQEQRELLAKQNQIANMELNTQFNSLSNQKKTARLFQINNFGIFNSDCAQKFEDGKTVIPSFVSSSTSQSIQATQAYLINCARDFVLELTPTSNYQFSFQENENYTLCVFANHEVYYCSIAEFKKGSTGEKNEFAMKSITEAAKDIYNFKKALALN